MLVVLSFFKRIVTVLNKRTCELSTSNNIWSKRRTEARKIKLSASLYLQEDMSSWNSILRTAQVSIIHSQMFLFTDWIYWCFFYNGWRFSHIREKRLCVFCCVLFCLFQVPLISCASPWRAGDARSGAYPNLLPLLRHIYFFFSVYHYISRIRCLIWLKFFATFLAPHGQ
jgi:hypothetical protein